MLGLLTKIWRRPISLRLSDSCQLGFSWCRWSVSWVRPPVEIFTHSRSVHLQWIYSTSVEVFTFSRSVQPLRDADSRWDVDTEMFSYQNNKFKRKWSEIDHEKNWTDMIKIVVLASDNVIWSVREATNAPNNLFMRLAVRSVKWRKQNLTGAQFKREKYNDAVEFLQTVFSR